MYNGLAMKSSTVLATALNFLTLLLGIAIGFYLRPAAYAYQKPPETKIQEVQPAMTAGAVGFGVVMAGTVETDHLVVNGYDMVKLNEGLLNYLATRPLAERADLQRIIDNSKPDIFYRIKPPEAPKPENPKPEDKKGEK